MADDARPDPAVPPGTVVRWTDGRFVSHPRPAWWHDEYDFIWSGDRGERNPALAPEIDTYGDDNSNHVRVLPLRQQRGWLLEFWDINRCLVAVWAATDAELLDLLTSRVPAWTDLRDGEPGTPSALNAIDRRLERMIKDARR